MPPPTTARAEGKPEAPVAAKEPAVAVRAAFAAPPPESRVVPPPDAPFATITEILVGSPADVAGLRVGDLVVTFGDATAIDKLKPAVLASQGPIPVWVDRSGMRKRLEVTPGVGPLGCRLHPLQTVLMSRSEHDARVLERIVSGRDGMATRVALSVETDEPRTPTRDDQLRAVLNGATTVPRSIEKSTVHRRLSREDEIVRHQSVLTARLERLGLRERKCKDDGHCQFRALAAELFGDSSRHAYVRRRVVEELRRRADEFSVFVDGDWEYFLAALAKDAWGDELTLQAIADSFSVVVHVVTSTEENWHLVYAPRALTARACFLSYVHPVHYNVVTDVVRGDGDPQSPVL